LATAGSKKEGKLTI